jgi:hypothetical protein
MAAFLIRSALSRGDLRLYLSNDSGYPQDAFEVLWTVFASDGVLTSGKRLPAIRAKVGEYYAPWFANAKNGNYRIDWEVRPESGLPARRFTEQFFVVDPSSYGCQPLTEEAIPKPGEFTYLSGYTTRRGDLPLFLKNSDGVPINAFAVFWTIYDAVGRCVSPKTYAVNACLGEYYAVWHISVCSGDYLITWEWMACSDSPLESRSMRFSVINPPNPYTPLLPVLCGTSCFDPCSRAPVILAPLFLSNCSEPEPCGCGPTFNSYSPAPCGPVIPPIPVPPIPPSGSCCPFEIPRTVHLLTQILPPSGNVTSQPPYMIPHGVHHVTFYITYTRGAPGGFPTFYILWGNGVEETQETLVDSCITISSPYSTQNMFLQDLDGPAPQDNNPISFILYVTIPGGSTTVRLIASEKGVPGAPGTLGITLTASS